MVMTNLSYLQDPEWIAEREEKWRKFEIEYLDESSPAEISARKAYFFTGDVNHILNDKFSISLIEVISNTPFKKLDLVIDSITIYWVWVNESPGTRDWFQRYPNLNERFLVGAEAAFSITNDHLDPGLCVELFHWLYGKEYTIERKLTLITNSDNNIVIDINVNQFCQYLMSGLIRYIWHNEINKNIKLYKALIPYFLSIYPHMSPECFSTTLPKKYKYRKNGQTYNKSWLLMNRWLLTSINGFITEYEEEDDIEELISNDDAALQQLKKGLDELKMPDEYYQLQEFVLKHKGDSLYASE